MYRTPACKLRPFGDPRTFNPNIPSVGYSSNATREKTLVRDPSEATKPGGRGEGFTRKRRLSADGDKSGDSCRKGEGAWFGLSAQRVLPFR